VTGLSVLMALKALAEAAVGSEPGSCATSLVFAAVSTHVRWGTCRGCVWWGGVSSTGGVAGLAVTGFSPLSSHGACTE